MNQWVFEVDGQPLGKGRPRFTRAGRVYTPERTRIYEAQIAAVALIAGVPVFERGEAVEVDVWARFARPKRMPRALIRPSHVARPDADNIAKAILDGIKAHLRDEQVAFLSVEKFYAAPNERPRVLVAIRRMAT